MMKKMLLIVLFSVLFVGCVDNSKNVPIQPPKFAVISDLHFGRPDAQAKVAKALEVIVKEAPVAIFVVGDITNMSTATEYNQAIEVFKSKVPDHIAVYFMMGNHDRTLDQTGMLFEQKTGQQLNQTAEIGGCPFIMLSVEGGITVTKGDDCYSSQTRSYLEQKLKLSATNYPRSPIFVFGHIPPTNTIWGTHDGADDQSSAALLPVLKNYPSVIYFSGHTHYPVADERSIHQREFTTVNDGGSAYGCVLHDVDANLVDLLRPKGSEEVTEALIVSVNSSYDVSIKRLDTYRGVQIKKPWIISAPHDGSKFIYTDARTGFTPTWDDAMAVSVVTEGGNTCMATFNQAKCEDLVYSYNVELVNSRTNEVVSVKSIFSQYWNGADMPVSLAVEFDRLLPVIKYFVRVSAKDSFGNLSSEVVSETFSVS